MYRPKSIPQFSLKPRIANVVMKHFTCYYSLYYQNIVVVSLQKKDSLLLQMGKYEMRKV